MLEVHRFRCLNFVPSAVQSIEWNQWSTSFYNHFNNFKIDEAFMEKVKKNRLEIAVVRQNNDIEVWSCNYLYKEWLCEKVRDPFFLHKLSNIY